MGGDGATCPKLPTHKFEFLLGCRSLIFGNAPKKFFQIFLGKYESSKVSGRMSLHTFGLEGMRLPRPLLFRRPSMVLPSKSCWGGTLTPNFWGKSPPLPHGSHVSVTSCQITAHMAISSTVQRVRAKNGTPQMMDENMCIQDIFGFCVNLETFVLKENR